MTLPGICCYKNINESLRQKKSIKRSADIQIIFLSLIGTIKDQRLNLLLISHL